MTTGSAAAAAVVAGGIAQIVERRRVESIRAAIPDTLPRVFAPGGAGTPVPAAATVDPATPFITPNGDFYRIDTALSFPRISLSSWKVDIHGLVDKPLTLELRRPVGVARRWNAMRHPLLRVQRGRRRVHLQRRRSKACCSADLLDEAGVQSGAEQVYQHQPRRVGPAASR